MMFLLAALVADLIALGFAYAAGDSVTVLVCLGILVVVGFLIAFEYEKLRMRHARR